MRALGKDLIVQETKRKSEHRITAAAGLVTINIVTATVFFSSSGHFYLGKVPCVVGHAAFGRV